MKEQKNYEDDLFLSPSVLEEMHIQYLKIKHKESMILVMNKKKKVNIEGRNKKINPRDNLWSEFHQPMKVIS